jgi:tetratricopeptide (TPR) repeat protein
VERVSLQLQTVRTLIRNRFWAGTVERVKAVHQVLEADRLLTQRCERTLVWLAQETNDLLHAEANLPRSLSVAREVLGILPSTMFPALRARVTRLGPFLDALLSTEQKWKASGAPAAKKIESWFTNLLETALLGPATGRRYVFASPQRWPTVAASLDPAAYKSGRILVHVAIAEQKHRNKDFGSARKQYEAILAKYPKCVEALEGLALVLAAIDDMPQAIECYREAIRLGTREARSYNNLSWYLCMSARPTDAPLEEAVWAARRAVELAPIATFWDTLAEALERSGDLAGAIAAAREAIRDNPEREVYRERMRRLCEQVPTEPDVRAQHSDFELPILEDVELAAPADSSSEFELTLDGDGEEPAESDSAVDLGSVACEQGESDSDMVALDDEAPFLDLSATKVGQPCKSAAVPADPAGTAAGTTLPRPVTDQVHFSVTAPALLLAGKAYILDVWAHLAHQRQEMIERARDAQRGKDIHVRSKGGVAVARGTSLTVHVSIPDFVVSDPENVILWEGDLGNATFPFRVPKETEPDSYPGMVSFRAGGLEIAKLHFDLEVGQREAPPQPLAVKEKRFRTAFASYASKDRDAVLARVQGIQKAIPQLDIFLDVASLRSGQHWAEQLAKEVTGRDIFYLFWSAHARASEWVRREWQMALQTRGIDYIDPIPLVSPDEVPPPVELATHLHFNDWVLAYMRGRQTDTAC